MAKLFAIYQQPKDPAAFDDYYRVATLEFDSVEAVGAGMASAEGQATAADLANFAEAGVDVMMGGTEMV